MFSVAGYTGKQDDSEVGLVYFGARYYVPAIARWASADPLWVHGMGGGPNPYAYVGGSPLQNIDPTGLQYEGPPPPDPPPGVNDDRGGDTYGNSGPGWGNGGGSGGSSGGGGGVHGNVPPEPSSMPSLGGVMAGVGSWTSRASASAGQWWQRNGRTVVTAGNFALNCALVVSLAVPVADAVTGSILAARLASAAVAVEAEVIAVDAVAALEKGAIEAVESRALVPYYPVNNGFLGATKELALEAGQVIDRVGGNAVSRFFSPVGTPLAARSLPPGTAGPLRAFEVLKPFSVESGTVAPAFGEAGFGTQF